jgi:hypothetical protein
MEKVKATQLILERTLPSLNSKFDKSTQASQEKPASIYISLDGSLSFAYETLDESLPSGIGYALSAVQSYMGRREEEGKFVNVSSWSGKKRSGLYSFSTDTAPDIRKKIATAMIPKASEIIDEGVSSIEYELDILDKTINHRSHYPDKLLFIGDGILASSDLDNYRRDVEEIARKLKRLMLNNNGMDVCFIVANNMHKAPDRMPEQIRHVIDELGAPLKEKVSVKGCKLFEIKSAIMNWHHKLSPSECQYSIDENGNTYKSSGSTITIDSVPK